LQLRRMGQNFRTGHWSSATKSSGRDSSAMSAAMRLPRMYLAE
jgi:hypothetical protein